MLLKYRILFYLAAFAGLMGCSQKVVIDNQKFQELKPFQAKLLELKEIPTNLEKGTFPSPMTAIDYKVTLEKDDGTVIIIPRVSGTFGIAVFTPTIQLEYGTGPTIVVGNYYTFPDDLYKNHKINKE